VDRKQKEEQVSSLREIFEDAALVVVTHYSGMTVSELGELRGKMREAGANFKVTKNRLTKLALAGTKFEGTAEMFSGPTAIAYSKDPVAAAKAAVNFSKTNDKLIVLGGAMGSENLDVNRVKALATLPSLDELRAKIVGMIATPATRVASVLQAPAAQVARVIGVHANSGE
jgi:large subunit ribosomal protein L10